MSFPETLKSWRMARRFSQLDLALEAEVSARHVSFLETGRARPSAAMIARLGAALNLPMDAMNQMLTAAGFAAKYPARAWEDAEMAPIRAAIAHTLKAHAPYPALAINRLWVVEEMNGPAAVLFGGLGVSQGDSLIDLMCSDALPPLVENWPEVAHHAAQRSRVESAAQGGIAELDRAVAHLSRVPRTGEAPLGPVVPTVLNLGGVRLSLFATIAQLGTAEDLLLEDLKIELYFPNDPETEAVLRGMALRSRISVPSEISRRSKRWR